MGPTIQAPGNGASFAADSNVGISVQEPRKIVSDESWFADMCRKLLSKPGLELHLLTGVDERSCHRYAGGEVRPPAHLLRTLLRSERGDAVLAFVMDGAVAAWWSQLQRDRAYAAAARAFVRGMESM